MHVSIDPEGSDPVVQRLQEPLEAQLTSALEQAAEQTRSHYRGESVDEVERSLLEAAKASLHPDIAAAWHPDEAELRRAAAAIVNEAEPPPQS